MIDYTTIVAVDREHFRELKLVWPTWRRFKPSLLDHKMIVTFDQTQVLAWDIAREIDHPNLSLVHWPFTETDYSGIPGSRWDDPQRHKMLAAFVYTAASCVDTEYWLKLDTDVVAKGMDDWIDPSWFDGDPAIVAHRWGYTKPADQMLRLDEWAKQVSTLNEHPPLGIRPDPNGKRASHSRIISWCGFFRTEDTRRAAEYAYDTCGPCKLPVASQDGYQWYVAARQKRLIRRVNMKARGWAHVRAKRLKQEVEMACQS